MIDLKYVNSNHDRNSTYLTQEGRDRLVYYIDLLNDVSTVQLDTHEQKEFSELMSIVLGY